MYKTIEKCRICGGKNLNDVMSLGEQALTGVFPHTRDENITSGPVDLVRCTDIDGCGLVQLKQSYDLQEMYGSNYGYRSGLNASMVRHLHLSVEKILKLNILEPDDVIIDIGSNDATTLRAYPKGVYQLIGVDPTGLKFSEYYTPDIKLIPNFFSAQLLQNLLPTKSAKVITSFSMFYDLEDPVTFAQEIEACLHKEGLWIFEQSYLPAMLRTNSFDTICHEHLEFYTLKQINWIAEKAQLKIIDVEFNDVNGGSFSITVAKKSSVREPNTKKIEAVLFDEQILGLESTKAFDDFKARVEVVRTELMDFLVSAKNEGKRIYGLGASTKGNVLLQYFGIDETLLPMIAEVNEDKYGSYTPGSLIPLVPEEEVLSKNPDFLLVLPWHFRAFFEINPKMKGRKLIFPLPNFEIVKL
jgi:NDP-4-keto-2,6-dideoxyhexose 3-C-methyltransferase